MSIAFSGLPPFVHSSTCRAKAEPSGLGSVRFASLPAAAVPVGRFGCSGSGSVAVAARLVFSGVAAGASRIASLRPVRGAVCGCVGVHVARCTLHVVRHVKYRLSSVRCIGSRRNALRCIAVRRNSLRRVASHCLLVEHLALRRANFSEQRVDVVPAARGAHAALTRRSRAMACVRRGACAERCGRECTRNKAADNMRAADNVPPRVRRDGSAQV